MTTVTSQTSAYRDYTRPLWRRLLFNRDAAVIALLIVITELAIYTVPYFGSQLTLTYLLLDMTPILLIALPMCLVILTGEIDLSVASVVGLSSVMVGLLHEHGASIPVAALVALVVGVACGALNGFLVAYVGLPSLAVTIGTLALFRGLAVGSLGTKAVTHFPERWADLASANIGSTGVPVMMIPVALLVAAFAVLLHFSNFGRGIYDIGLNKEAAHFTGVSVARTKLILFVLTGVISAFAGIFYTLRFGSARGDNASGMELQVIAAVLLGGVSIFGGRGRLAGVIGGVLLIGVISSALRLESVTVNVISIIIGLLLVASVVAMSVLGWVSDFAARRNRRGSGPADTPAIAGTRKVDNP
ncbi:MAG: ABC transporter permease [Nocardioidaceae bacterium]